MRNAFLCIGVKRGIILDTKRDIARGLLKHAPETLVAPSLFMIGTNNTSVEGYKNNTPDIERHRGRSLHYIRGCCEGLCCIKKRVQRRSLHYFLGFFGDLYSKKLDVPKIFSLRYGMLRRSLQYIFANKKTTMPPLNYPNILFPYIQNSFMSTPTSFCSFSLMCLPMLVPDFHMRQTTTNTPNNYRNRTHRSVRGCTEEKGFSKTR